VLLTIVYLLVVVSLKNSAVEVQAHVPSGFAGATGKGSGGSGKGSGSNPGPGQPVQVSGHGAQYYVVRSGGVAVGTFVPPNGALRATRIAQAAIGVQQKRDRSQLLLWSVVALAVMAVASIVIGWVVAGRVLAPLRTMTARARRISADSLDARLALSGPDDELKELGDTIDGLLERLEHAFDAQRRFVANASHELRTPLTLERATLEVALADPYASEASLRAACERVLAAGAEQERLITALLDLARSERGLDHREAVALDDVVAGALSAAPVADGVTVTTALEPARVSGDARLLERLAANLLENALEHNVPSGWVRVGTATEDGRAVLRVSNGGPKIEPGEVDGLIEPFRRADGRLSHRGHGLGLSIVAAIASAHDAELAVRALDLGGLEVGVTFPPVAPRPLLDRSRSETRGDSVPAELEVAP
jgi:signal transduction histidine kinase